MRRVRRRNGTAFAGARPTDNPIWQSCVTSERGRFDRAGENRLTRCQLPTSPWSSCCQLTNNPCPAVIWIHVADACPSRRAMPVSPRRSGPDEFIRKRLVSPPAIRSLMTSARPCDPHYGKGDTRFNLGTLSPRIADVQGRRFPPDRRGGLTSAIFGARRDMAEVLNGDSRRSCRADCGQASPRAMLRPDRRRSERGQGAAKRRALSAIEATAAKAPEPLIGEPNSILSIRQ